MSFAEQTAAALRARTHALQLDRMHVFDAMMVTLAGAEAEDSEDADELTAL